MSNLVLKLQNYFHNNPKRIAIVWIFVHVFFLLVGQNQLGSLGSITNIGMFAVSSLTIILLFPALVVSYISYVVSLIFGSIAIIPRTLSMGMFPFFYYTLFFYMIWTAKNTQTRQFKILHRVFTSWFLLALVMALYGVFVAFNQKVS